jgi:predicted CXXCH cytochrome family protein
LCLACHKPHASDLDHLLRDNPETLCLNCHAKIRERIRSAKVGHDAVLKEDKCLSCHEPHASDTNHMLKGPEASVCLSCHAKDVRSSDGRTIRSMTSKIVDSKFKHGPVKASDCTSCHEIHGSRHSSLLRKAAPKALMGRFDIKYFTLCFDCHTDQLVTEEKTRISTQFRDGEKNLHFIHVNNRGRGRSCTTCHAIHGSNQGRHISKSIFFEGSGWQMRLEFTMTPSGGTCATECHEQLDYSRKREPSLHKVGKER